VFCQLVYLRRCIPARIRRALNELPETLDETYARALKEIDKPNWEYAHRIFQCVTAASRPFRVEELGEFLAFDFDAGPTPTFLADWRPEDPTHTVLSTCSSLLAVVNDKPTQQNLTSPPVGPSYPPPTPTGSPVIPCPLCWDGGDIPPDLGPAMGSIEIPPQVYQPPIPMDDEIYIPPESPSYSTAPSIESPPSPPLAAQFAHFSVKEYLTSPRLAQQKDTISRFHVSMTAAHTIISQACLGVLLHLDENITNESLKKFPLAEYAAEHWVGHARFENVASNVLDGMKRLFDPTKCHFSVWVWIYDSELPSWRRSERSERLSRARATPLHHAAVCNMPDIATFLIVEHSQDVNSRDFDEKETPLHVSSRHGHVEIARVLLDHGADTEARDDDGHSPLDLVVLGGHVELAQVLLEHGADANAQGNLRWTSLYWASYRGKPAVAQVLLSHGADVTVQCEDKRTPLHLAGEEEVARLLLEHGADANALDIKNRMPLHCVSELGRVGAARVLLEHGVNTNARDANNATPLHLTSSSWYARGERLLDVVQLLLQYGPNIHAWDDEGQTPFMRATARGFDEIMQLLLEHGVEDHRA
jgi:ankyrin repeat protein